MINLPSLASVLFHNLLLKPLTLLHSHSIEPLLLIPTTTRLQGIMSNSVQSSTLDLVVLSQSVDPPDK